MRSLSYIAAAGLWLAPFMGAYADEPVKGSKEPAVKKPAVRPAPKPKQEAHTCSGDYGTDVLFEDTPSDAAAQAKKDKKLVFVLHISGHFEDPKLT